MQKLTKLLWYAWIEDWKLQLNLDISLVTYGHILNTLQHKKITINHDSYDELNSFLRMLYLVTEKCQVQKQTITITKTAETNNNWNSKRELKKIDVSSLKRML